MPIVRQHGHANDNGCTRATGGRRHDSGCRRPAGVDDKPARDIRYIEKGGKIGQMRKKQGVGRFICCLRLLVPLERLGSRRRRGLLTLPHLFGIGGRKAEIPLGDGAALPHRQAMFLLPQRGAGSIIHLFHAHLDRTPGRGQNHPDHLQMKTTCKLVGRPAGRLYGRSYQQPWPCLRTAGV